MTFLPLGFLHRIVYSGEWNIWAKLGEHLAKLKSLAKFATPDLYTHLFGLILENHHFAGPNIRLGWEKAEKTGWGKNAKFPFCCLFPSSPPPVWKTLFVGWWASWPGTWQGWVNTLSSASAMQIRRAKRYLQSQTTRKVSADTGRGKVANRVIRDLAQPTSFLSLLSCFK